MTKILFVGCDGIRRPKSGGEFVQFSEDQEIIPGADKAIDHAVSEGFIVIGITNQGGVAAGKKSLQSCLAEQRFTFRLFPNLAAIYFCPDFEGNNCWGVNRGHTGGRNYFRRHLPDSSQSFRKPGIGMISLVSSHFSSLSNCYMVGGRPEDEQCAEAAGIDFMPADIWRDRFLLPPDSGSEKGVYIV